MQENLQSQVRFLALALAKVSLENEHLRELAHRDALTELSNRRGFEDELDKALRCARRYHGQLSVLLVDLDGMKILNDRCGHPAGDAALQRVADVLRTTLRTTDTAARLGGDEFAVVLPATDADGAHLVAERIRALVSAIVCPNGVRISASIGVATAAVPIATGAQLVEQADIALYEAKRAGKDRVTARLVPVAIAA